MNHWIINILFVQAFSSVLQHELTEYYKFIATVEAQVAKELEDQQQQQKTFTKGITLKKLLVWSQDYLLKFRLMSVLVECCKQQRGGALVSTIYKYTDNGDPFIQNFINNILEEVFN